MYIYQDHIDLMLYTTSEKINPAFCDDKLIGYAETKEEALSLFDEDDWDMEYVHQFLNAHFKDDVESEDNTKIKTYVNGKEYKYYDQFKRWLEGLKQGFIYQKEYHGFPNLPSNAHDGYDIFLNADADERRYIFDHLLNEFTEALRHWKVDKDMLWTEEGRKRHKEFMEQLDILLPHLKDGWERFY